jgi:HEAT repeat protein
MKLLRRQDGLSRKGNLTRSAFWPKSTRAGTPTSLCDLPAVQRALLVPALRAMLPDRSGDIRLNIARALFELGDHLGWQTLHQCLTGDDAQSQQGALKRLSDLSYGQKARGYKMFVDAGVDALERPLAAASACTRREAIHLLARLNTPRAISRLVELFGDERPDVRAEAAICIGDASRDQGALAVLNEMLRMPGHPKRYFLVRSLEHLCKSPDVDICARAAAVAVDIVRRDIAKRIESPLEANLLGNDIWHCMDGIAAAQSPEEREILHDILASKTEWWVRGMALKRLAELEGKAGIERLLCALSDSELRVAALEGLSLLARGSSDPVIIEALAQEIAREDTTDVPKLVEAFLAIGGGAPEVLDRVVTRVDRDTAMTIHWLRAHIDPAEAVEKLGPAFGEAALSAEQLEKLKADWDERHDAQQIVWGLLGEWNRLGVVMRKTVDATPNHDEVVADFAKITGDQFSLSDIVQTVEPDGQLRLLFVHRDQGYSFRVEHHGRYVNVRGILDGLNDILKRLGHLERFIALPTGTSDVVLVTFAHPDMFLAAATRYAFHWKWIIRPRAAADV